MHPEPGLLLTFDGAADAGGFTSMLPMLAVMGLIFYFVLYRPQKQEAEAQAKLVASLQKGDRVVTGAGIHGRIHEAKGATLVLEISPKAFLTVDREAVRRKVTEPEAVAAEPAKGA